MSTPLTATKRIEFQYTVGGLPHKYRAYAGLVASGDPTGYDVIARAPGLPFGASVAIDRVWTLLAPCFSAATTVFGNAVLQSYSAGAWLPLVAYTTAVAPTGAAAYKPAAQLTLSMRDSAYHKVRAVFLEQTVTVGLKTTTPHGFGAPFDGVADGWVAAPSIVTFDPGEWVRGRSDLYLNGFVSMVTDLNDKLRRARGIA